MPVRPIDMLTMLPRLNEASRQQNQVDFRPILVQHTDAAQMQVKNARSQRQVNQKADAEEAAIRREQDGRKHGGRQQPQQRAQGGEPEPAQNGPKRSDSGHRLDVKV